MICRRVRVAVHRVSRHPIARRTLRSGALLRRHVFRGATLGIVPDAMNDMAFHHAKLSIEEIVHIFQDTATISTMTAILAALLVIGKQIE